MSHESPPKFLNIYTRRRKRCQSQLLVRMPCVIRAKDVVNMVSDWDNSDASTDKKEYSIPRQLTSEDPIQQAKDATNC